MNLEHQNYVIIVNEELEMFLENQVKNQKQTENN